MYNNAPRYLCDINSQVELRQDFYALSSRLTIRRLLADYLDQKVLLVSEVLHCAEEADKLLAILPLMKSAVMTAAGSHARLTGRDGAASAIP